MVAIRLVDYGWMLDYRIGSERAIKGRDSLGDRCRGVPCKHLTSEPYLLYTRFGLC